MAGVASEFVSCIAMTHGGSLLSGLRVQGSGLRVSTRHMQPAPSFDFQFPGGKTQYIRALSPVPCSLKVFCFVLLREVVVEIVFLIVFEAAVAGGQGCSRQHA